MQPFLLSSPMVFLCFVTSTFDLNCYRSLLISLSFLLQYQPDDQVTLWVNKVGPYNNPQETYNYYSLPFCGSSGTAAHKWGGLGEVLGGNELIDSQIPINFESMYFHLIPWNLIVEWGWLIEPTLTLLGLRLNWVELVLYTDFFLAQKMWTGLSFVDWILMKQRLNSSRMQLIIVTGLNSLWVCFFSVSFDVLLVHCDNSFVFDYSF